MKHKKSFIKKNIQHIFLLSFIFAILLITISTAKYKENHKEYAAGNTVTFTPKTIPFSDPEIARPWRTPIYAGSEASPPELPLSEAYQRWCWAELEPSQGQYDFSKIDALMAKAKTQGGQAGFRVMPVNTSGQTGSCLPSYISSQTGEPPDWNNPVYLDRAQALLTALGKKYDTDPRMGWYEIGPYGNWGEWNLWTLPNNPMTPANKERLIQMSLSAFPHKRLLMLSGADKQDGGGYDALSYAMNLSPAIGIRSDCLGSSDFGGATQGFGVAPDRWKQAPIVLEYCGGADLALSYDQLKTYHATMLADGDGNLQAYTSYSSTDQQQLITNFKTAGYRFILNTLTLPSNINAGEGFNVSTNWSNINVTPAYLPWDVMLQFRNSAGTIAWQGKSQLNLTTLLPTPAPVSISDTFTLPATVPAGTYTVAIQIIDPSKYYAPLSLAIQGKQTDGSYTIGTITVGGTSGVVLTPTIISNTTPTNAITMSQTPTIPSPTPKLVCIGACPTDIITSTPSISTTLSPSGINIPSTGNMNPSLIKAIIDTLLKFLQQLFGGIFSGGFGN